MDGEGDIHKAYDKIYEENIKILSVNNALGMKVKELELEKEKLLTYLKESTSTLNELKSMHESLDAQVKNLTSELKKTSIRVSEPSEPTIENETYKSKLKIF